MPPAEDDPLAQRMDRAGFLDTLAQRFPEIAASITDVDRGLLHLEMAVVSAATQDAIANEDWAQVQAHFNFIDLVFASGTDAVRNAVYVSYLENVFLGEDTPEHVHARELLSADLRCALLELKAHLESLQQHSSKVLGY